MSSFRYWPYDELSLSVNENGTRAKITLPWFELSLTTRETDGELVLLAKKMSDGSLGVADIPLVSSVFQSLSSHPICYILPFAKGGDLDQPQLVDQNLVSRPLPDFLAAVTNVSIAIGRQEWEWDAQAALGFATVDGRVHPESLFSVARRYHLLDVVATNAARRNFDFIESLSKADFALAAGLMVRQNHYVTQQCQSALRPALDISGRARPLVEAFMNEEKGHDRILGAALKAITDHPESLPASAHAKVLMSLLTLAAERNFLAFALAVDCFERSSYSASDPLAELLQKGGYEKAAKQVDHHKAINDAGEHESVALDFLRHMAPCDPDYALEALRLAEAITVVINGVSQSAIDLFEQLRAK